MLTVILAFPFQYMDCFSLSRFSNYYSTNLYSIGLERKDSKHHKIFCHYLTLKSSTVCVFVGGDYCTNVVTCATSSHCLSKFHQVKSNVIEFLELMHPIQKSLL